MYSGENKEKHPSYGMLGFYRRHGGDGLPLFGSSIKHKDTIGLVLKEGSVCRDINKDWFFGGKKLFEVEMSGEQFVNLLTNMNCGDGVPVTIRYTNEIGHLDYFDVPFESRSDIHVKEFANHCDETIENTNKLLNLINEKFDSKKTLNKADKEEIKNLVRRIQMDIGSNVKYQMNEFNEQIEQMKSDAKAEIEMFWQNKLLQLANQSIVENRESLLEENKNNILELE